MASGNLVTLLLSGGASPEANHYSQYLQALRLNEYWSNIPKVDLVTMFGSGLTPDRNSSASPDVSRAKDEYSSPIFIYGELPDNQPATKNNVQAYFRTTLKNRLWTPHDRLLLFVADHGNPNGHDPLDIKVNQDKEVSMAYENNCISLWAPGVMLYPEKACLSVSELKGLIQKNIPSSVPVNFVMTQCFSGAFHMLGYRRDENGFPHQEGNVCGFTAITRDTTASGCTSFVKEGKYDGYERRIVEAMTGVSVINGQHIAQEQASLSVAHDAALLLDNTKDIPLRSSEAYALDYIEATKAKTARSATAAFELSINSMWQRLQSGSPVKGLNVTLQNDMKRRLALIGKLVKQVAKWQTLYSAEIASSDLSKIGDLQKNTALMALSLMGQRAETDSLLSGKQNHIRARYLQSLNGASDASSKEFLEFETIGDMSRRLINARLRHEDPTLKKYERFLRYEVEYWTNVLAWADKHPEKCDAADIAGVRQLRIRAAAISAEMNQLSVLSGELRRIESQMIVAAAIAMATEGGDKRAVADITSLVKCENAARSAP